MKIIALKTIMILCFNFFAVSVIKSDYSSDNKKLLKIQQQTVPAFMYLNGGWIKGSISYYVSNEGYLPLGYYFRDMGLSGQFLPGQNFIPLNPNNNLAKQYNWTHYIRIQGTNAFFTLY